MAQVRIFLFGTFSAYVGNSSLVGLGMGKLQELLCYVLLHRDRTITREALASLLWEHRTTAQSKAYLRRALWKLNHILKEQPFPIDEPLIVTDKDCVCCNPACDVLLDVDEFEEAIRQTGGVAGHHLDAAQAELLQRAVSLYEGDLLENYYQDWCLYKRERYQYLYLTTLDRLAAYWEVHGEYARAFRYVERILSYDHTREQTHRQLMLLKYLSGDRTGAIQQYERCETVLKNELGIAPDESTKALLQQIKQGRLEKPAHEPAWTDPRVVETPVEMLTRLKTGLAALAEAHDSIRRQVEALEGWVNAHDDAPARG